MADDKKLLFKTAYLYFQEGRWDKAIVEFKRLAALDPEDLTARNMLGDAFMKKGLMREAYEEYAYSAEGYSKKGEPEKANAIYKKMSKLEVNNLDAAQQKKVRLIALVVRGDQAYEAGNYEDASQAYQEVVNIDPAQMDVVAKLAEIYTRLGRNKEAAVHWFGAARFYMDNRLFKRALIYFQKVVELEPGNVEARLSLGELLAREGQELEARKEFQAIADIYISLNQLDKAQQCCQKALALKSIDAHWQLGEIFIRRSQWDEARTELDAFLKIKANHVQAQFSLGIVLLNKNLLDEALGQFGKILGRQPDHVESLERMAEIYEKKGSTRDAVAQRVALGRVFVGQRILDRAEAAFRLAIEMEAGNVEAQRQLGEVLEMRGMRREAGEAYLAGLAAAREQKLGTEIAACEAKIRALDPALLGEGGAPPAAAVPAPVAPAAVAPSMAEPEPVASPLPTTAPAAPPPPPPMPTIAAAGRSAAAPPPPPPMPALATAPKIAPRAALPPAPVAAALKPAPMAAFDPLPAAAAPVRAKATLTPQQRAQRLVSMATSALRQGSFDEALDMLEQAKTLVPDDAELKEKVQAVLVEYASKSAGRRPIPGMAGPMKSAAAPAAAVAEPVAAPVVPAAAEPAPAVAAAPVAEPAPAKVAETVADIERRMREQIEKEYRERKERSAPETHADTREQVLARAGAPDEPAPVASAPTLPLHEPAPVVPLPLHEPVPVVPLPLHEPAPLPPLTPPPPPAYHRADEPPRVVEPLPASESAIQRPEPVPAVVGAGAGSEPVRARPRVSYV